MTRILAAAALALAICAPVTASATEDDPYGDPTHAWAAHVPCNDPSAVSIWEADFLNKERPDLAAFDQQVREDLNAAEKRFEIQMRSATTDAAQNDAIASFSAAKAVFQQKMAIYANAAKAQRCKRDEDAHAAASNEARAKADADRPRIEAEAKAKIEAERAQIEADAKAAVRAKIEADLRAKAVAEATAKAEADAKSDIEAATQAKDRAAADAKAAAEARLEAEAVARNEDQARKEKEAADAKAREDARLEAEAAVRNAENVRAAKAAHDASVRADKEAAATKASEEARIAAEAKAAKEAAARDEQAKADAKAAEIARLAAEAKAAEEMAARDAKDQADAAALKHAKHLNEIRAAALQQSDATAAYLCSFYDRTRKQFKEFKKTHPGQSTDQLDDQLTKLRASCEVLRRDHKEYVIGIQGRDEEGNPSTFPDLSDDPMAPESHSRGSSGDLFPPTTGLALGVTPSRVADAGCGPDLPTCGAA